MDRVNFDKFIDDERIPNGKLARVFTTNGHHIPLNILIENYEDIKEKSLDMCYINIIAECHNLEAYKSKDYLPKNAKTDVMTLLPIGVSREKANGEITPDSPHILFSGIVDDFRKNDTPSRLEATYSLRVRTTDVTLNVVTDYKGKIDKGYLVRGIAFIYGDLKVD